MPFQHGRRFNYVFVILICFVLSMLTGCSKEAKKERHWGRGEKYFSENKFKEAIIEYKNVLQIEPKDAKARYKLGLAYLKAGQFREAFSEFTKSVDVDPELLDARIQLGNLYLLSREPLAKVSEKDFEKSFPEELESIGYRFLISIPSEVILRMIFYPLGI